MDGLAGPPYRTSLPPLEIIASMGSYLLRSRYLNLVFRAEFYVDIATLRSVRRGVILVTVSKQTG